MGSGNKGRRNSNVEALRIFGMFLIAMNHFMSVDRFPNGTFWPQFIVNFISELGGVGDWLFFGISAWFLCQQQQSWKRNIKRMLSLEGEVLFYSIAILVVCDILYDNGHAFAQSNLGDSFVPRMVKSLFPILSATWWYPSAYMLFLLICPSLTYLLKNVKRNTHKHLAVVLFCSLYILNDGRHFQYWIVLFIVQYVILSYFAWYRQDILNDIRYGRRILRVGLVVGIVSTLIIVFNYEDVWPYLNNPWKMPSALIGMGLLFTQLSKPMRTNRFVSYIANRVLPIYLILTYPLIDQYIIPDINEMIFDMSPNLYVNIAVRSGIVVGICLCCILIDIIRQVLFSLTIDRLNGKLAVHICNSIDRRFHFLIFDGNIDNADIMNQNISVQSARHYDNDVKSRSDRIQTQAPHRLHVDTKRIHVS